MGNQRYLEDMLYQSTLEPDATVLILGRWLDDLSTRLIALYPEIKVTEAATLSGTFYPSESLDCVFSVMLFNSLSTYEKIEFLQDIHRILRPGGTLLLLDWGKTENRWIRFILLLIRLNKGVGCM